MAGKLPVPPSDLDWIKLREEMNDGITEERMIQKLIRKCKSEPLVPIGCLATTAALSYGLWAMKKGDRMLSQYMMRTRVVAQGFTIAVAVFGMTAASRKNVEAEKSKS